jgi:hypothetical protein
MCLWVVGNLFDHLSIWTMLVRSFLDMYLGKFWNIRDVVFG